MSQLNPEHASHPVSIVTGAGSGIGAATARLLAARGHACVLVGRSADKLEEVRASLSEPTRHLVMPADVADSGLCFDIVDRTLEAFGRIDSLVLSAGTAPKLPIERTTEETLEECFFVNTFGSAYFVMRAWPHFKSRRAGRVVFVSTLGTLDPFPGFFAYAASKAAVDSFARSIRAEGRSLGVHAFAYLKAPFCGNKRFRHLDAQIIKLKLAFAPKGQCIGEARGGYHTNLSATSLNERVREKCRRMYNPQYALPVQTMGRKKC